MFKKHMKKFILLMIGIIGIIGAFVFIRYKNNFHQEKVSDTEKKSIIDQIESYPDILNMLENLYEREQMGFSMTVKDNRLKISGGSTENISVDESEIVKFFSGLECESINIENEQGIKFMRIVLSTRVRGVNGPKGQKEWYDPVIIYCAEQEKYLKDYGKSISEYYGGEFRENWYFTRMFYT